MVTLSLKIEPMSVKSEMNPCHIPHQNPAGASIVYRSWPGWQAENSNKVKITSSASSRNFLFTISPISRQKLSDRQPLLSKPPMPYPKSYCAMLFLLPQSVLGRPTGEEWLWSERFCSRPQSGILESLYINELRGCPRVQFLSPSLHRNAYRCLMWRLK